MAGRLSTIRRNDDAGTLPSDEAIPELAPESGPALVSPQPAAPGPSLAAGAVVPPAGPGEAMDDAVTGHLARAVGAVIEAQAAAVASPAGEVGLATAQLELQSLVNAARVMGVSNARIAGAFAQYGERGDGVLRALQSPAGTVEAAASTPAASREDPAASAGGGSAVGTVLDGIARLVAAPITLPVAAGSRVWQTVKARGAVARLNEQGAVLESAFDEAYGRAIEKIAHIKSGPMNGLLTEMVHNPLKPDEQYRRMATDVDGEYRDRAQRMEQTLLDPRVQQQYQALRDAVGEMKHRADRLGAFGAEHGRPVSDRIEGALAGVQSAMQHEGVALPTLKDGKLGKLSEQLGEIVERIKAMLANLFGRQNGPAA